MRTFFLPQLVNGPFGDPALLVEFLHRKEAFLLDCGDLSTLSPGKMMKITHLFISHAHMDHFMDFDRLVRQMLGRDRVLRVFGPAPILDQVIHKMASYSWNLVRNYQTRLTLEVVQLREGQLESVTLDCRDGFRDPLKRSFERFDGIIFKGDHLIARAVELDHQIPSLAFCLEQPVNVQVLKGRLEEEGLRPGGWLQEVRLAVLTSRPDDTPMEVRPPSMGPRPLGWLKARLLRIGPGQRLGYVVDAAPTEENKRRIVQLVRGADLLYIEAPFLLRDRSRAEATSHLTAHEAGRIALEAGVKRVVPFHFSPKYLPDGDVLEEEVYQAMGLNKGARRRGNQRP
jgi:ribonuclease Z